MRMQLTDVLHQLSISDALDLFAPHWDESEACLCGVPDFLQPDQVRRNRDFCGLALDTEAELLEVAERIRATPALTHLAWHCHRLLYGGYDDYPGDRFPRWPALEATLGEQWGVFYLLVTMSMVPLTLAAHQVRGVPEEITRDTCTKVAEIAAYFARAHAGRLGADLRIIYWTRHYVAGELYLLGRMEYMIRPFHGPIRAFRHRGTHEVIALAQDGIKFAEDGFINAQAPADAPGWTSRLLITDDSATGTPISPFGMAVPCEVTLPLKDWEPALTPGDLVLDTHIPGGGKMGPEACQDTMARALEFFPRYFPERPFKGFACGSWILNPELDWIYFHDNNMVLWQKELYLFPIPSGQRTGLFFVFGTDDVDPATAPRDTSLRRALLEHLEKGGRLIAEGMFSLTEDFVHYGTQFYRRHWPPSTLPELAGTGGAARTEE